MSASVGTLQAETAAREYLAFTGFEASAESAASYMHDGGFPRYLQVREAIVLQELFDDIVYRDVIVRNRHSVIAAIQACVKLTDEAKDREIDGLVKAMEVCTLSSGIIVTENQRDSIIVGKSRINVLPYWDWAMSLKL